MPSALPVFYYRLVKRSRMFYKRHRRPLCQYRSPAISPSLHHQYADLDRIERTYLNGGWMPFLPIGITATRSEFENGTRIPQIGRDESGDRRSVCTRTEADIHTTGAPATGFIVRRSATCMHVGGGI